MEGKVNIVPCSSLADVASLLAGESEVFVVYDRNVEHVAKGIPGQAGNDKGCMLAIETSEQLKTIQTVEKIERWLIEGKASRGALILAIGGGITTDMAGFAAAIYKRGIRWAALPTTLLGQVDAAIGGKTGVNLDGYKNMVGAFHMPEFTFIVPGVLETLPAREMRAGLAEMLKTFIIGNGEAYEKAVSGADWSWLVYEAAKIKARVVEADPFEHGERAKLNLGHTFGHAIEHEAQESGDDIMHGEAVAMGIILAARLSEAIGLAEKGLAQRLKADFEACGLPAECPYTLNTLVQAMKLDKKAAGGKVKFILPVKPGDVVIKEMTVEEAIDDLRKYSE